jgi:hypothetical protein
MVPPGGVTVQPLAVPKASIVAVPAVRTSIRREKNWEVRRLAITQEGQTKNLDVVHLRGIEGIEASDLPDEVKHLLVTHARLLPPDEAAHYVVNRAEVIEWAKTHPAAQTVKAKKKRHRCHSISMNCAKQAAKHAEHEAERQAQALRKNAQEEWDHVVKEVGHDLKMTEDALRKCFADHTLSSGPKKIHARVPLRTGKFSREIGSGPNVLKGAATMGLLVDLEADAEVEAFIIPCAAVAFPLWVRPKSVALKNGTLKLTSRVDVELDGRGKLRHDFDIPFPATSGYVLPPMVILVGAVPVELDIALEFEGKVAIDADGALQFKVLAEDEQITPLNFICDGHGCRRLHEGTVAAAPRKTPPQVVLNAQGRVTVRPSLYSALRLDVNFGAFSARVGPEVYLVADFQGAVNCPPSTAGAGPPAPTTDAGPPAPGGAVMAGTTGNLWAGLDLKYIVDIARPEGESLFKGGSSAHAIHVIPRSRVTGFQVGSPAAVAAAGRGAPATPCRN